LVVQYIVGLQVDRQPRNMSALVRHGFPVWRNKRSFLLIGVARDNNNEWI